MTGFAFGLASRGKLNSVHADLYNIAQLVMSWQVYDFTIVWGYRGRAEQEQAFLAGNSKKRFPHSRHNKDPSTALDFAPWVNGGIPWNDTHAFAVIGGMFIAAGAQLGTPVRWGADWNRNGATLDQTLMDFGHVELVNA